MNTGGKLREIRRRLNATQEDIAGNDISRNLLSTIENNKTRLTKNTAKIIVENINRIAQEKNIDLEVDIDYFFTDEYTSDIDSKIKEYLKEIDQITLESHDVSMDFLIDMSLTVDKMRRSELYIKAASYIADKFFDYREFSFACKYYEGIYNYGLEIKDLEIIEKYLFKYINTLYMMGEYNRIILVGNSIIHNGSNEFSDKIYVDINYYNALVYLKIKDFRKCIKYIDLCLKAINKSDIKEYILKLSVKGNCYIAMNDYLKAREIFAELKDLAFTKNDRALKILALSNLLSSESNIMTVDRNKVLELIDDLNKELASAKKEEFRPKTYLMISDSYYNINMIEEAQETLFKTLDLCIETQNYSALVEIIDVKMDFIISFDLTDRIYRSYLHRMSLFKDVPNDKVAKLYLRICNQKMVTNPELASYIMKEIIEIL